MPRRSFRSRLNENTSKMNEKTVAPLEESPEEQPSLQTYYCPNEMKKQLADALKEAPNKNNKKNKQKVNNNNNNLKNKKVLRDFVPPENNVPLPNTNYAAAVRNSLTTNVLEKSEPLNDNERTNVKNKNNSDNRPPSDVVNNNNNVNKTTSCDNIIEDWEVLSSEELESETFHLVATNELTDDKTTDADKENRTKDKETAVKKKVSFSRKYIGAPDLPDKLQKLGFKSLPPADRQETPDEDDQKPAVHFSGSYNGTVFEVEAKKRCGLLVTSVKANSDSLLSGLTCLEGFIEDTGLLSYANLSLTTAMPHNQNS